MNRLQQPIAITGLGSISALGHKASQVHQAYQHPSSAIDWQLELDAYGAALPACSQQIIEEIKLSRSPAHPAGKHYSRLDKSVLYALYAARQAFKQSGWTEADFGVNIGSSRGATRQWEQAIKSFEDGEPLSPLTSPATTLGNISSWIIQDLQSSGPDISHSVTCSTGMHAILNGIAWLQAGLSKRFLVGGSEAALTPFTLAQMQAMQVYASSSKTNYPCRSMDLAKKRNTMVLGEGAAVLCLESGPQDHALAYIKGIGYATEELRHPASLSAKGACMEKAMRMAVDGLDEAVDAIVMHAPGTLQGDEAEFTAINTVFGTHKPYLTSNKWKLGHTFAASGVLSIEMALHMLQHQHLIEVPYLDASFTKVPKASRKPLRNILVNAVGFGGNAVSILVGSPG
ncbi:beta-ketoacyl synthase N-terminal-like domain-containing protein [Croceiramulus getboli]|nr:beta-ketoacyl synthase N-terminal-like domain-containing protein [Flavobacteriaceae bacterium YJPT1-3]